MASPPRWLNDLRYILFVALETHKTSLLDSPPDDRSALSVEEVTQEVKHQTTRTRVRNEAHRLGLQRTEEARQREQNDTRFAAGDTAKGALNIKEMVILTDAVANQKLDLFGCTPHTIHLRLTELSESNPHHKNGISTLLKMEQPEFRRYIACLIALFSTQVVVTAPNPERGDATKALVEEYNALSQKAADAEALFASTVSTLL